MTTVCPCCGCTQTNHQTAPAPHQHCPTCAHRWRLSDAATHTESYYAGLNGRNDIPAGILDRKLSDRLASLTPLLSDGMEVLEVGCAEGALGFRVKQLFQLNYTGIELSNDAETAQKVLNHVVRVPSAMLQHEAFDLIVSFHVLEHIVDIRSELLHWHRLLKESGTIVVEVPNQAGHPLLGWDANTEHLHQFSPRSLLSLFETCGFRMDSMTTGHYESPVYSDSLRIIARPRQKEAMQRQSLLNRFSERLGSRFAVYGIGGDFNNYVAPLLDHLPVTSLIDSDPKKHGTMINGIPVSSIQSITDTGLPILIASIRYKDDIKKTLKLQGVQNQTIGLDELYDD